MEILISAVFSLVVLGLECRDYKKLHLRLKALEDKEEGEKIG